MSISLRVIRGYLDFGIDIRGGRVSKLEETMKGFGCVVVDIINTMFQKFVYNLTSRSCSIILRINFINYINQRMYTK